MNDERMNDEERARAWLAGRPNFEVASPDQQAAARFPLERPAVLVERLGRPDRHFKTFLVAGTKGKGSTAAFLASMLQAHGVRVGLYSQPHLHSLRERLRVDGNLIAPGDLAVELERVRPVVEELDGERPDLGRLTAYEITTAVGLNWFARVGVEWAVLEVGLGGRLDATNVVRPAVAVITAISYDHTHILGRTLPEIAAEKAGIVKPSARVVSAPQRPAALATIRRVCRSQEARLTVVGASPEAPRALRVRAVRLRADAPGVPASPLLGFEVESARHRYGDCEIYLGGWHQITNALTAVAALEAVQECGLHVDPDAVREGLATARWPGRLEPVRTAPLVVLDGAHNGDSAERLMEALRLHFEFERLHLVLGVFADKDLAAILRPLRAAASLTAVQVGSPRARPAREVAEAARGLGIAATEGGKVGDTLEAALERAGPRDLVCVTGSLAVVAAAREALGLAAAEA
jgi:dihydrofolate synthase/folylpolyglutamate synthase